MTPDTYNLIIILLAALVAALTWAVVHLGRDLRDTLPPTLVELFPIMFRLLEDLAAKTPTPLDDQLVSDLHDLFERPSDNHQE
jgi:hypothetical protein